jgi:hypothetical protein
MRALRVLPLTLALACASSQSLDPSPSPPPPVTRPASSPPPALPREPVPGGAAAIEGAAGLARVCESLRDEASMTFSGNAVGQAQAREDHVRRREDAQHRRYIALVPPDGFSLANYDLGERRLLLDTSRGFRLAEGAELLSNLDTGAVGFRLAPEGADRILVERAAGKVFLRVVFRPSYSKMREQSCLWISGGGVVKMEIELESATLLTPDGGHLAQGDNNPGADQDAPVARPQVLIKRPRSANGVDAPEAPIKGASALATPLLRCYKDALSRRPALRGTLVLGVKLASDGSVEEARMELSSLGDEPLAACAVAETHKAKLMAGSGRISLTLLFGSRDD